MNDESLLFLIEKQETIINPDGSITIIATMLSSDAAPEQVQCGLQLSKESEEVQ